MKLQKLAGPLVLFALFAAWFALVMTGGLLALRAQAPTQSPTPRMQQPRVGGHRPAEHSKGLSSASLAGERSDGALQIVTKEGIADFCPLKHTDVNAEISGFLARVSVTQEFANPSPDKVEAIYTFPLPQNAAVNDMTMTVGGRIIKGLIKKREEAQQIYQKAIQAGHTAALLDQERPNIFTQSVGNIPPGGSVKVEITYIETLKYEAGVYEFVYPMVVGPRYIPGAPTGKQAGGWSPDTSQVPDASRITPPVAGVHYGQKGTRAGHDISLAVKLDAGVTIQELKSPTHEIDKHQPSVRTAEIKLRNPGEIPNRDFVLRYDVGGAKIEDALLATASPLSGREQRGGAGSSALTDGFFTFILQPPDRVRDEDANPRELIFVLDTSGSMSGFPIETAKKVMKRAIEHMRPQDTFNLVTFAGDTHVLFPQPVSSSASNIAQAIAFLDGQHGGGGTEMMKAIRVALGDDGSDVAECKPSQDCAASEQRKTAPDGLRIVCFMTDGYVGNDMEIIGAIQKHPEARVFSFGIGSSVNRFLLDKMAEAGRGEVEYVLNEEETSLAADRFYERVHTPVLTDISVDWHGLPVTDVLPPELLDLFTAKPLVLAGRFSQPATGMITVRGKRAGKAFERTIKVELPADSNANQALAQLWARKKIDEVISADWNGLQSGSPNQAVKDKVTQLGLDYRLMTQFTSFVAVEEQTVVEGGKTRTIQVPVEMPQGVSPEGVFGETSVNVAQSKSSAMYALSPMLKRRELGKQSGVSGGVRADVASARTAEARPAPASSTGEKDADLALKLHRDLLASYRCWQEKRGACSAIPNGKVQVEVWLTRSLTRSELEQIFNAGLAPRQNKSVLFAAKLASIRGAIEIEKLPALAKLPTVRLISLAR